MRIHIITLFPEFFRGFLSCGIVGKSLKAWTVNLVRLGDYSPRDYKGVDDAPYGGGQGMVIRADVLKNALLKGVMAPFNLKREDCWVLFPSPAGKVFNYALARQIGECYLDRKIRDLVFICGRYEGIDERFIQRYVDEQISLGDFILSGGEVAVMAILESALRFVPGVLGNDVSAQDDSFEDSLLEGPVFTRPPIFEGQGVPDILLSGHHGRIAAYRRSEKVRVTRKCRPDLFEKEDLI